jgi:hypothetical protein
VQTQRVLALKNPTQHGGRQNGARTHKVDIRHSHALLLSHGIAMKCLVDPSFGLLEGQFAFELYHRDITITFLPYEQSVAC